MRNCTLQHTARLLLAATLTLSSLLAGCAQSPIVASGGAPGPAAWASATATNQWNEYATDLIARHGVGQLPAARTLAYLNLAIHKRHRAGAQRTAEP